MKILLCMLSRELAGFHGFMERFQARPALGPMLLTAVLREAGHAVDFVDQRVESFSLEQWLDRAAGGRYDLVGLTTYSTTRRHHARYIAALRARYQGAIVAGGPGVQPGNVDFWLDSGADAVVLGEGERTAVELAQRLEQGRELSGTPGTAVRAADGRTIVGPARPALSLEELEALPYPAWSQYWIERYVDSTLINIRTPTAGVITARGCPYRCAFCGSPSFWSGIRQRSVEDVIEELDWLVQRFGVRHIVFVDDVFGLTRRWTLEFCEALRGRPYSLKWMICLHPLSFGADRAEVYGAMADAGLNFISFGAQSADPMVLREINRDPAEIDAVREAIPLCRELGIATALTYIFGLPGDTPATAEAAVDLTLEVRPTLADFHPLYYFVGSELGDRYPDCDANPYSYEEHKRWCASARRRFYLAPGTAARLAATIARSNPLFLLRLARMAIHGLPHYLFEPGAAAEGESGDRRT